MPALRALDFDAVVDFVATGGYALKAYDRFARIREGKDGRWRIANPNVAQRYRLNVGTIVEADMLKVRLVRSRASTHDSARRQAARRGRGIFRRDHGAGRHVRILRRDSQIRDAGRGRGLRLALRRARIRRCRPTRAESSRSRPISPRGCATSSPIRRTGASCRRRCASGSKSSNGARGCPASANSWSRHFRAAASITCVCYPFEGRLAHQTLGMLLTRRLERARLRPLGFVANEYALAVWGLGDVAQRIARGDARARCAVRRGHAGRRSRSLARRNRR